MSRPMLVRRDRPVPAGQAISLVLGTALAFAIGALLLLYADHNPVEVYQKMFDSSMGSSRGWAKTLNQATPLALCGLAVAVAGSMGLWNIGAEGQLLAGAIGAAWVARIGPEWSGPVLIVAMIGAGAFFGLLWAAGPALARAQLGVNEIITTLMLNEIAIRVIRYLVENNWKDPGASGFPQAPALPTQSSLPTLFGRAHIGVLIAIAVVAVFAFAVNRTPWGYELRIAGTSAKAAGYAGISLKRKIFVVLTLSGGIAGLAGAVQMTGNASRLTENVANGYGFAGIIVAALALMRPAAILPVAVLFGAVRVGGDSIQTTLKVSSAVSEILQGLILAGALVVAVFMTYRLRMTGGSGRAGTTTTDPLEAAAHG